MSNAQQMTDFVETDLGDPLVGHLWIFGKKTMQ